MKCDYLFWFEYNFIIFAAMKRYFFIGSFFVVLALMGACHPSVKVPEPAVAEHSNVEGPSKQVPEPVEGPSPELSAIDSLMWHYPDSALMRLLPYFDTCRDVSGNVSTTAEYNHHYANLLLAELLYKNDYEQTNRPELLHAVTYFDSLTLILNDNPHKGNRHCRLDRKSKIRRCEASQFPNRNDNIVFLSARAHYINGVGYYENDSVVPACKEYLKALEVMEGRIEEKELTGKKAIFMTYTYNRLTELFSAQFMMDPAITCGERALMFCRIEPTSAEGVSNILYCLGKQYDKMNEVAIARQYYGQALESMTNTDNLVYRDIVSSKALCDYLSGSGIELPIAALKRVLFQTDDVNERLTRYLTIGGIFFEEGKYDSALYYLKQVFERIGDKGLQAQAANYLRIIYDSQGSREQSDAYMRFLSGYKKTEGENKAMVSKLEDMFKTHMNQKKEIEAEEARKKSIRKTVEIVVPIAVMVVLGIIVLAKLRGKELLKKQQEEVEKKLGETKQEYEQELRLRQAESEKTLKNKEKFHQQEMEAKEAEIRKEREQHEKELDRERKMYRKEKEALEGVIQESAVKLEKLEVQLEEQKVNVAPKEITKAFIKEPVCQKIMEDVRYLRITTRDNHYQSKYAISDDTFRELGKAVERNYCGFDAELLRYYKDMKQEDFLLCYLYLLGLNEKQIAVLRQCSYSAIKKQADRLGKRMGIKVKVAEFVKKIVGESGFTE